MTATTETTGKKNAENNGFVQRGPKNWAVVLDLGDQMYRQCPTCRRRFWLRDGALKTCKRDGATLDEPRSGRRQQWKSGFPTKAAAKATANEARAAVQHKTHAPRTDETLGQFLDAWLRSRTEDENGIRATTVANYAVMIDVYVKPRIGDVRLTDVTADALDGLYADLSRAGGRGCPPRPLKPKAVRNVHVMLHRAFVSAVKKRRVAINPADACDAVPALEPTQVRDRRMRETIWSPEEMRTYLRSVEDDRLYAAWLLLCTTGMRRGEVLGLAWSSVHLDNASIQIEQALTMVGRVPTITSVKCAASAAKMPLDPTTVTALRRHKKQQAEEQLAWGRNYVSSGLVFCEENGEAIHPDRFLRAFKRHARTAGLRPITIHTVRHSYASALLSFGQPMKVISERLRHAGIAITADRYTHLSPDLERSSAEAGAAFILRG